MDNHTALNYDIEQFDKPIFSLENLDSIFEKEHKDGLYHFDFPRRLDIYMEGFETHRNVSTILVCFNAAVGNRASIRAPFFSGLGVNQALKLPLIAISDPVVSSTTLSLAWYAGGAVCNDLQEQLAIFLNGMATRYHAKLILFGGSGGGFASLATASYLHVDATLLVSNPQTSISNYIFPFVKDYIEQAFPEKKKELMGLEEVTPTERSERLRTILEECNILHDITNSKFRDNIKIIYLQNKSDSHVLTHAIPFIKNKKWITVGNNSLQGGNIAIHFGAWGKGHVGPNKNTIIALLSKISAEQSIDSILIDLEEGLEETGKNDGHIVFLNRSTFKIWPKLTVSERSINVDCHLKRNGIAFDSEEIKYAFYLMDNGKRIATRYYTRQKKAQFDLPSTYESLYIRCFARDKYNQIIASDTSRYSRQSE